MQSTKLFLLMFSLFTQVIFTQVWNTQMVYPGAIRGSQSLFFDSQNNPVILYNPSGIEIFRASWNGSTWTNKHFLTATDPHNLVNYDIHSYEIIKHDTLFVGIIYTHAYIWYTHIYYGEFFVCTENGTRLYTKILSNSLEGNFTVTPDNKIIIVCGTNLFKFNILSNTLSEPAIFDGSPALSQSDVAVGMDDRIWISYKEGIGNNLKVARSKPNGEWDYWFVDTEGNIGDNSEIWIDNNNIAHIVYYDATNQKLKYATFNP